MGSLAARPDPCWPGCNRARAKDSAGFPAFSPLEPRRVRFSKDAVVQICMIDLRPSPTRPLHALSKTRRPPTRPRGHRIACASGRIWAIHRRIKGTEEEESGGSRRRPKSVILRVHAPSPWPWRRPFVRAGGSVRHRQTAGKTPPAQSSQPSAEELRARSRTGTLKFRRNPWHWRDRTRWPGVRETPRGVSQRQPWDVPDVFPRSEDTRDTWKFRIYEFPHGNARIAASGQGRGARGQGRSLPSLIMAEAMP